MIIVRPFSKELVKHSPFDSGEESLDRWLKEQAGQRERRDSTRTFIAADEAQVRVAGYYSTVTYELAPESLSEGEGGARRFPVPAVLIARLAVDKDYQGKGIGGLLLVNALQRLESASRDIGFEMVVVDALHETAACFYLKYGFRRFVDDGLKLFITTKNLRATFAATSD